MNLVATTAGQGILCRTDIPPIQRPDLTGVEGQWPLFTRCNEQYRERSGEVLKRGMQWRHMGIITCVTQG